VGHPRAKAAGETFDIISETFLVLIYKNTIISNNAFSYDNNNMMVDIFMVYYYLNSNVTEIRNKTLHKLIEIKITERALKVILKNTTSNCF